MKILGEKLTRFALICRSLIISALNIQQDSHLLTTEAIEFFIISTPNSFTSEIAQELFDQTDIDSCKNRFEFSRNLLQLLKQIRKIQLEINSLNDLLIKSVLPKIDLISSSDLPSSFFNEINPIYQIYLYEIPFNSTEQNVYIRSLHGQLEKSDVNVLCTDNPKHILSEMNYHSAEKYSFIYDIEFQRVITSRDQLTIALPCFAFPVDKQQISIRCS